MVQIQLSMIQFELSMIQIVKSMVRFVKSMVQIEPLFNYNCNTQNISQKLQL